MIKHNQYGSLNVLLIPLILVILLFLATAGFGFWAYGSREDYKNNVDQKISAAVQIAKQQESTTKDKQFAEAEKQPLKTYTGPEAYGSLVISYPKTWSSYVDDSGSGDAPVNGYFYPGTVPSTSEEANNNFALRVEVVTDSYSDVLAAFQSQQQAGQVTVSAYSAPKVPKVVGVRLEGQIAQNKTGSMVILPLRDKTLEIWTEAQQFENDFNNNILPNFNFSP